MRTELFNALPDLAPDLQELEFNSSTVYTGIFIKPWDYRIRDYRSKVEIFPPLPTFSNLKKLILNRNSTTVTTIDSLLKANPQLKEIHLIRCNDITHLNPHEMFKSIADHVPHVEKFAFETMEFFDEGTVKYFGQLKNLKTL